MIRVFFDASVLFCALYSKTGASSALIFLIQKQIIRGITTQTVIQELVQNIDKLNVNHDSSIYQFIAESGIMVCEALMKQEDMAHFKNIEEKDVHVVAAAVNTKCQYLVTLDKKHLNNARTKKLMRNIRIYSPKELLTSLLKT